MKQRYVRIVVVSALTLQLVISLAGIILLFTPLRPTVAYAYFVWDWLITYPIKNAFICYFVGLLQLLVEWWPLRFGITKTETLKNWGFSTHIRLIRSAAIVCFLLSRIFCIIVIPELELQRIAYFKKIFTNAFS